MLTILDLDRLRAAPLHRDPFEFVLVESFLDPEHLSALVADFPEIRGHGSFPVDSLEYGPAFARLVVALTGAALRHAVEEKFDIDLSGHPTLLTVRGKSDGKDGRIHTDSESKIITLLLYLNPVWDLTEGRLRLLRGPAVRRELNRHRWSARLKALNPFRSHRGRPSPAKEGMGAG